MSQFFHSMTNVSCGFWQFHSGFISWRIDISVICQPGNLFYDHWFAITVLFTLDVLWPWVGNIIALSVRINEYSSSAILRSSLITLLRLVHRQKQKLKWMNVLFLLAPRISDIVITGTSKDPKELRLESGDWASKYNLILPITDLILSPTNRQENSDPGLS